MTDDVGIDVSLETSGVCIVDGAGTIIRERKVPSDPAALGTALTTAGPAFARVGLEAGPPSPSGG